MAGRRSWQEEGAGAVAVQEGSLGSRWHQAFMDTLRHGSAAAAMRDAAVSARLAPWTEVLTSVVVQTCESLGWRAAAKGHRMEAFPEAQSEYLTIDVTAFPSAVTKWAPVAAAIELENSRKDDRIGYSLWKVLHVRAALRAIYCYRPDPEEGAPLVRYLNESVIGSLPLDSLRTVHGQTYVVVGYRNAAETFPDGFFRWWSLNTNTASFELLQ